MQAETVCQIDEHQLPPQLRRIVRTIGLPATLTLLKARGGTRLMLGKHHDHALLLIGLIGPGPAQRLCEAFEGKTEIMLPKADKLLAQARNRAIRAEHACGDSLMTLALRYDLTIRQIENINSAGFGPPDTAAQAELF